MTTSQGAGMTFKVHHILATNTHKVCLKIFAEWLSWNVRIIHRYQERGALLCSLLGCDLFCSWLVWQTERRVFKKSVQNGVLERQMFKGAKIGSVVIFCCSGAGREGPLGRVKTCRKLSRLQNMRTFQRPNTWSLPPFGLPQALNSVSSVEREKGNCSSSSPQPQLGFLSPSSQLLYNPGLQEAEKWEGDGRRLREQRSIAGYHM